MPKTPPFSFKVGDLVAYPAHGVGRIIGMGPQDIHGVRIDLVAIRFEEEGLTLRVPKNRIEQNALRGLVGREEAERALKIMSAKPRGKSGTWSRRAREYEQKIQTGDLLLTAEVVRDLRSSGISYSERMIFERALTRVAREIGHVLGRPPEEVRQSVELDRARSIS